MAVITISKEFGTESEKVASQAAKKLGYEYIGEQLIAEIAKELHVSESEAEIFRKTSQSRILRFVDRYTCSLVQKVIDREYGCLDDKNYYETTKKLVQDVYDAGNAIILGWGSQCILRGNPNTLHVRLVKDEEIKIREVMKNRNLEHKAAKTFIERAAKAAISFIRVKSNIAIKQITDKKKILKKDFNRYLQNIGIKRK